MVFSILMKWKWIALALVLLVAGTMGRSLWARAEAVTAGGPPKRQTEIVVSFTEYQWWLTRWADNQAVCGIPVEHEGLPTSKEVEIECGKTMRDAWLATPPCEQSTTNAQTCEGLYLFLADTRPGERTVVIDLPIPTMVLSLSNCTPTPPRNECAQVPGLVFTGEEPLPNEQIVAIHVQIGSDQYDCPGSQCEIPMRATPIEGQTINFWAVSSYGDETQHYDARVRIVDGGAPETPGTAVWYVDVISSQWRGSALSSCAAAWEAFPPLGEPPPWLSTPETAAELASDVGFVYLAGQFIQRGIVDASACPQNGLLENGAASECGLEAARPLVYQWQDNFDQTILNVSRETSIPARLMKNLFAQESQFWPGVILRQEYGLGQLTSQGADTPLLWNPSFFNQFCPLVLHESVCAKGYTHLQASEQAMLRGALASRTDATCPDCDMGIDLAHAEFSVDLFAQTLLGNCEQVAYIVYDATGKRTPGVVSSYEDLWRYTLVNYNAGPGCLIAALQSAWRSRTSDRLDWSQVAAHIGRGCEHAITYVDRVTRNSNVGPPDFLITFTPEPTSTGTPRPTSTRGPSPTPGPTSTPTPTATARVYP